MATSFLCAVLLLILTLGKQERSRNLGSTRTSQYREILGRNGSPGDLSHYRFRILQERKPF
jgi:hypothetical protein